MGSSNDDHGYITDLEHVHSELLREIWIEDDDEPIRVKQYLNTHRYNDKLNIYPRSNGPDMDLVAQIHKEFKRGEHPKEGVLECVFEDMDGVKWMQIFTKIEEEYRMVLLNLKYWQFD